MFHFDVFFFRFTKVLHKHNSSAPCAPTSTPSSKSMFPFFLLHLNPAICFVDVAVAQNPELYSNRPYISLQSTRVAVTQAVVVGSLSIPSLHRYTVDVPTNKKVVDDVLGELKEVTLKGRLISYFHYRPCRLQLTLGVICRGGRGLGRQREDRAQMRQPGVWEYGGLLHADPAAVCR